VTPPTKTIPSRKGAPSILWSLARFIYGLLDLRAFRWPLSGRAALRAERWAGYFQVTEDPGLTRATLSRLFVLRSVRFFPPENHAKCAILTILLPCTVVVFPRCDSQLDGCESASALEVDFPICTGAPLALRRSRARNRVTSTLPSVTYDAAFVAIFIDAQ